MRSVRFLAGLGAGAAVAACGGAVESVQPAGEGPAPSSAAAPSPCEAESWSQRLRAPIAPPRHAGDIDLAGPNGAGLTLGALGALTCAPVRPDPTSDKATASIPLDPSGAIFVYYDTSTLRVATLTMTTGYAGALEFAGGGSSYRVVIGAPITKDGAPLPLEWGAASFRDRVDELHRALAATFAPGVPVGASSCVDTGVCVVGAVGNEGFVTFTSVGTTIWVATTSGAQHAPSTPSRIDQRAP